MFYRFAFIYILSKWHKNMLKSTRTHKKRSKNVPFKITANKHWYFLLKKRHVKDRMNLLEIIKIFLSIHFKQYYGFNGISNIQFMDRCQYTLDVSAWIMNAYILVEPKFKDKRQSGYYTFDTNKNWFFIDIFLFLSNTNGGHPSTEHTHTPSYSFSGTPPIECLIIGLE